MWFIEDEDDYPYPDNLEPKYTEEPEPVKRSWWTKILRWLGCKC